jgi:tetratricopeptide (TPR) repeat protein
MNRSTIATAVVVIALLVGSASAAPTASDAASVAARRHFQDGSKAFSLGEFEAAIKEYRAAYNAKPDPAFLYNIAQAYRLAGDAGQAVFFYKSYLHNLPEAPNRQEVEERIVALEPLVARSKTPTVAEPAKTSAPTTTAPATTTSLPAGAQPVATTTTAATTMTSAPAKTPLYKKWWLWTAVGVVAAGAAVGIGLGVTQSQQHFDAALGTIGPTAVVR